MLARLVAGLNAMRNLTPYLPQLSTPAQEKIEPPKAPITKMDITYFTTLNDYEEILLEGERHAS